MIPSQNLSPLPTGALSAEGGGQLDRLLVELAGFGGGEALSEMLGDEQEVPIDCAYADLQADGGTVTLKTVVVDTSDTLFTGSGTFDLAAETLDGLIINAECSR